MPHKGSEKKAPDTHPYSLWEKQLGVLSEMQNGTLTEERYGLMEKGLGTSHLREHRLESFTKNTFKILTF